MWSAPRPFLHYGPLAAHCKVRGHVSWMAHLVTGKHRALECSRSPGRKICDVNRYVQRQSRYSVTTGETEIIYYLAFRKLTL